VKPSHLTRSIGTKVREEEYDQLERTARLENEADGLTVLPRFRKRSASAAAFLKTAEVAGVTKVDRRSEGAVRQRL
jgi:hypothetical protein